jgi:hypothetical protein
MHLERKPTFRVHDDDEGGIVEYGPDEYEWYEYSEDGNWLILDVLEAGELTRKTFFIGYPA